MATGPAAIRYILANDPDVSAVVGDRIYPDWLCQDAVMPAITLWAVSSTPFDTMSGGMGMEKSRVRVECISQSRANSDSLWLLVNKALSKVLHKGNYGGIQVCSISQGTGSYQMADRPYDGSDRWLYRTIQSFDINYYLYEKE